MTKTLADISDEMKQIDFCMLVTRATNGTIGARPMSNNREVDSTATSWFFTYEEHRRSCPISNAIRRSA